MRKKKEKLRTQLIENFLNLIKKQGEKPIIHYFVEDEKLSKPN